MKYAVVLCDGMADYPLPELGGKTPMEAAKKPHMDALAAKSEVGLCKTVADGLKPGSDVANLSVMGYDPRVCYTGRSPLEAANIGVQLEADDVALRCNLVTLSDEEKFGDKTMVDYCAGDISTQEADLLVKALKERFGSDVFSFYTGVSYRHCLVWKGGALGLELTPPHDISGRVIGEYLSKVPAAAPLIAMMEQSMEVLAKHPVNQQRKAQGKRPANACWFWGEGKKPSLEPFSEKFGLKGTVVSAVDLIKGIGVCAHMQVAGVPGATGYIDTSFEGKAQAAVEALQNGQDFVYVHLEAPDECGHRHEIDNKVKAIEMIDGRVLPILLAGLEQIGEDYKVMILPDHPTPLSTMTHAADPVPYLIYQKSAPREGVACFSEASAKATGVYIAEGTSIMRRFLG